ncbi:hypothetical protein F5883DRAFT_587292 [Diaporthe sp. PMI_573]|nr:hypothetical protein F5883DRAFT_587292 [Diaporthaceae sp. PMI_573]
MWLVSWSGQAWGWAWELVAIETGAGISRQAVTLPSPYKTATARQNQGYRHSSETHCIRSLFGQNACSVQVCLTAYRE